MFSILSVKTVKNNPPSVSTEDNYNLRCFQSGSNHQCHELMKPKIKEQDFSRTSTYYNSDSDSAMLRVSWHAHDRYSSDLWQPNNKQSELHHPDARQIQPDATLESFARPSQWKMEHLLKFIQTKWWNPEPSNSSTTGVTVRLGGDDVFTHSLTPSWRHAAVMSKVWFWPPAPEPDAIWSEAGRRQMNQRLWRPAGSRVAFFLPIRHSVTSSLAACQRDADWACAGNQILRLLLFISFSQQWG